MKKSTLCSFAFWLLLVAGECGAAQQTADHDPGDEALHPGESLTYAISWSRIISAGTATLEIRAGVLPDGKHIFRFIATTRSAGLVDAFFPVRDSVESVFDPDIGQSLTFSLNTSHGKKQKLQKLVFDHANMTVISTLNNDPPKTMPIPDLTQDALSSLYYLRTQDNFIVGKPVILQVHDSGKNWAVEVQILGREKVTTPAGTFDTIKVRTLPRYEGVFMNKGEIFIWLTDDRRRVPVMMKSTISIGSIVSVLTKMESGKDTP